MAEWRWQLHLEKKSQSLFQQKVLCNPCIFKNIFNWCESQSLFQQKVLCNDIKYADVLNCNRSQSLFQQKVLCNKQKLTMWNNRWRVTILILVEGSLQYNDFTDYNHFCKGHNPYFSRRFFAIWINELKKKSRKKSQSLFQQKVLCNINKCG